MHRTNLGKFQESVDFILQALHQGFDEIPVCPFLSLKIQNVREQNATKCKQRPENRGRKCLPVHTKRGFMADGDRFVQKHFTIKPIAIWYRHGNAPTALFCGCRGGTALRSSRATPASCSAGDLTSNSEFGARDRLPAIRAPSSRCDNYRGGKSFSGRFAPRH